MRLFCVAAADTTLDSGLFRLEMLCTTVEAGGAIVPDSPPDTLGCAATVEDAAMEMARGAFQGTLSCQCPAKSNDKLTR